jgi:hypothetical protein
MCAFSVIITYPKKPKKNIFRIYTKLNLFLEDLNNLHKVNFIFGNNIYVYVFLAGKTKKSA